MPCIWTGELTGDLTGMLTVLTGKDWHMNW